MSTVFDEQELRFTFDREWHAVKWDDHPAFVDGLRRVQLTQGVDFAGQRLSVAWLIEFKDFRGTRIAPKTKFPTGEHVPYTAALRAVA